MATFTFTINAIDSVTRNNNGEVTMRYTSSKGKQGFIKTYNLSQAKEMYFAEKEGKKVVVSITNYTLDAIKAA